MARLFSALNIRPGEGWLVGWMLIYAVFMGVPALITETAAYSLFLEQFSAAGIPYIYIGFAVVTTLSGLAYTALEKRISFFRFATLNLSILALIPLLFRIILEVTDAVWALPGLAIWYEVSWALANLGFWSVAVYLFDLRQGKRLFGLIGIGLTVSESIAGFFVPFFVRVVGTANLLLVTTASFLGALLVQTYILRTRTPATETGEEEETEAVSRRSLLDLLKNHYIVLIFGLAAMYAISFYALDNVFYGQVELRYPNADALASFLGIFFGLSSLFTLVIGAFVSGKVISRYGLRFGLLLMPVVILVGVSLTAVVGTFFELALALFWLVIVTRFLNEILAYTINRAAWQVLYEPLPDNQRLQSQTVVESMVKPIAGGVAGLLLIAFNAAFGFNTVFITYLLVVVILAWIGVVIWINRLYPAVLLQALAKRRLSEAVITIDRSHIGILKAGIRSPHVGVVIYSLDVLEEVQPEEIPQVLESLLAHPAPDIRQMALSRLERFGVVSALPQIRHHIEHDPSPKVRGDALRALALLGGPALFAEIEPYLESSVFQLRLGAMVGLLKKSKQTGPRFARLEQTLSSWASSSQPEQRILAAQVFGEVADSHFTPLLLQLIYDDKLEVREAALLAAKKLRDPQIWSAVIDHLDAPRIRTAAAAALVSGGVAVLGQLKTVLLNSRYSKDTFIQLIRVCGRIRTPEAIDILKNYLAYPDVQVRTHVLKALGQCKYQADASERLLIEAQIKAEVENAAWLLAAIVTLEDSPEFSLAVTALKNDLARYRLRLFLLLSFIYSRQTILPVWDNLGADDVDLGGLWDKKKAYALEVIDVTISPALRPLVLPLLDNLTARQRLAQLEQVFPQAERSQNQMLADVITTPAAWLNEWPKAAALHGVGKQRIKALLPVVTQATQSNDFLVQETAWHALKQIDPLLVANIVEASQNRYDNGKYSAKQPQKRQEEKEMTSLVERVIMLKSVGIFSETPEDVLAEVAAVLEEIEVKAGSVIIEKGSVGSSLYIIVDGEVRVEDGTRVITTLSESEVFGEFSLLDPGPRTATVVALEATRLYRLDREVFFELLDDHSTIARKVIQVLVRYLRNAHSQYNTLVYRDTTIENEK